jgi:hypothetical protein
MKRLPSSIDVEKFAEVFNFLIVPQFINFLKSGQARAFEIDAMQTAMKATAWVVLKSSESSE